MFKKIALLTTLAIVAISERVFFDLGPNIEFVTTALILSTAYIGRKETFFLIAFIMFVTDIAIGNSLIFIFTWSGFLLPALLLRYFIKDGNMVKGTFLGVGSNVFFFIWTNFGVWLMSSMYAPTFAGLMQSYVNAIPFLKMQLTSTVVFVPIAFLIVETIRLYLPSNQPRLKSVYVSHQDS